mmetsp:Transcript_126698/g.370209  ORF Transcript_126698/g.370209 Transcript_126698/m.370209 type:complete len:280 (-) Transcript_126698:1152-1991(-)
MMPSGASLQISMPLAMSTAVFTLVREPLSKMKRRPSETERDRSSCLLRPPPQPAVTMRCTSANSSRLGACTGGMAAGASGPTPPAPELTDASSFSVSLSVVTSSSCGGVKLLVVDADAPGVNAGKGALCPSMDNLLPPATSTAGPLPSEGNSGNPSATWARNSCEASTVCSAMHASPRPSITCGRRSGEDLARSSSIVCSSVWTWLLRPVTARSMDAWARALIRLVGAGFSTFTPRARARTYTPSTASFSFSRWALMRWILLTSVSKKGCSHGATRIMP